MNIKIAKKDDGLPIPKKATDGSAGFDLMASLRDVESVVLQSGEIKLIPTGIFICLPVSCFAMICSRSGLALKNGIFVLNSPGIIDSDYRGEIGVILANFSKQPFIVEHGMRIAQLVIFGITEYSLQEEAKIGEEVTSYLFEEDIINEKMMENFQQNMRMNGGFGSTGL